MEYVIPEDLFGIIISYLRPEDTMMCVRVSKLFHSVFKPHLSKIRFLNDHVSVGCQVVYMDNRSNPCITSVSSLDEDGFCVLQNGSRRHLDHLKRIRIFPDDIAIKATRLTDNQLVIMECPGCHSRHYHAGDDGFRKAHCRIPNIFKGHYFISVS